MSNAIKDYSEAGKRIHYKSVIEFKGTIEYFDSEIHRYKIKIDEWIGKGYPHLYYYITKKQLYESKKGI